MQARLSATGKGAALSSAAGGTPSSAAGGVAAAALAASLSAFSAASATRTSLVAAPRSGCCACSLASSGLKPRSGSVIRRARTASSRASDIGTSSPALGGGASVAMYKFVVTRGLKTGRAAKKGRSEGRRKSRRLSRDTSFLSAFLTLKCLKSKPNRLHACPVLTRWDRTLLANARKCLECVRRSCAQSQAAWRRARAWG
eukprot:scaffold48910_cov56-Phaeocystis_antarctica.AAC.3